MQLKSIGPWLLIVVIVGTVFGWKIWQKQTESDALLPTQVNGPAVILIRGDNSPSCQAIHLLVDQAAARHGDKINFVQLDWSEDNPLIEKYQIRFLPTVVFVDQHDKDVGRIIGESPAVQEKLKQTLTQLESLLKK